MCVSRLSRFGILNGLENARLLERFERIFLLKMTRMLVLNGHSYAIHSRVRSNLDGCLVGDDGLDSVFCSRCSDMFGAQRTYAERYDANCSADRHASQNITFAGVVRCIQFVEMLLDNLALLARIVDCGRGHGDTNRRNTKGERDGQPRNRRGCRGA